MTNPIPYVQAGKLHAPDGAVICALPAAKQRTGWLDWLGNPDHRSFRFVGLAGAHCTVIKEKRSGQSGIAHDYWYAHRQVLGRLRRVYLGKSENLSLQVLEDAAVRLAQLEMGLVNTAK